MLLNREHELDRTLDDFEDHSGSRTLRRVCRYATEVTTRGCGIPEVCMRATLILLWCTLRIVHPSFAVRFLSAATACGHRLDFGSRACLVGPFIGLTRLTEVASGAFDHTSRQEATRPDMDEI